MRIEILNTGSELLLGRVLNTHQQWLCRRLSDLGYEVERQVAVPDTAQAICDATREALSRADLVITTGGLGPTSDDRTRDLIAQLLGCRLIPNEIVKADIDRLFNARKRAMPPGIEVQALVPEGAIVFRNQCGTAPGLALQAPAGKFRAQPCWLIMLPGPPNELRPMFDEQAMPFIKHAMPGPRQFACRTLKSTGIGESMAEKAIAEPLRGLIEVGLEVGYCARPGEVDVRLSAFGPVAAGMVAQAEQIVRSALGEAIFGVEDEELPSVIVHELTAMGKKLVVAESCTGGLLAHRLTNVPGSSLVFLGGAVTYANEIKQSLLGVKKETLEVHGAVSEPTAREMAEGARLRLGADFALAVTGVAGPGGGTATKPVGTVFIALSSAVRTVVQQKLNPQEREIFKHVTTQQALEMLRRELLGLRSANL